MTHPLDAIRAAAEKVLPDTLPGHWDSAEGREMAVRYAGKARDRLALPDHSDLALANALFLANGGIVLQTAAKDRMRWLSVQLALAQHQLDEALSRAEKAETALAERNDRIGTHGVGCATWGPRHYECALRSLEQAEARATQAEEIVALARELITTGMVNRGVDRGLVVVEKTDRSDPHYRLCSALARFPALSAVDGGGRGSLASVAPALAADGHDGIDGSAS